MLLAATKDREGSNFMLLKSGNVLLYFICSSIRVNS